MKRVLGNSLCDLDPKVKVKGKAVGFCEGVPSTATLVHIDNNAFLVKKMFLLSLSQPIKYHLEFAKHGIYCDKSCAF